MTSNLSNLDLDLEPTSNLLLDPLSELIQVIQVNAFGLDTAAPERTQLDLAQSFPLTPEDRERIARETIKSGQIQSGVEARAVLGLAGGEGSVTICLDRRGFTLLEAIDTRGTTTYPQTTFESLEALLIAHSPAYVQAMTSEIERRFAQGDFGQVEVGGGVEDAEDAGGGEGEDGGIDQEAEREVMQEMAEVQAETARVQREEDRTEAQKQDGEEGFKQVIETKRDESAPGGQSEGTGDAEVIEVDSGSVIEKEGGERR